MTAHYRIAWALLAGLILPLPVRGEVVELGGPRKVRVTVQTDGDRYTVTARMLPVTAFDETTNAALNRRKAELYALSGLGRHLAKKDRKVELLVSGAQVKRTGRDGKFYTLTLEVPTRGVRLVRDGKPSGTEKGVRVKDLFDNRFFTLKRDLIDTARGVALSLESGLAAAEKLARDPKALERALVQVTELEERGDEAFRKVRASADKEKLLLLSDEMKEIQTEVDRLEKSWRTRLRQVAQRLEKAGEKRP